MPKKCPKCKELVPQNSLTCPKCFESIPREEIVTGEYIVNEDNPTSKNKSITIIKFLSSFPALIGLLGLGHIYRSPREARGYWFLLIGLILFGAMIVLFKALINTELISAIFLIITLIIIVLIYISAAIGAFIDCIFGSIFKIIKF